MTAACIGWSCSSSPCSMARQKIVVAGPRSYRLVVGAGASTPCPSRVDSPLAHAGGAARAAISARHSALTSLEGLELVRADGREAAESLTAVAALRELRLLGQVLEDQLSARGLHPDNTHTRRTPMKEREQSATALEGVRRSSPIALAGGWVAGRRGGAGRLSANCRSSLDVLAHGVADVAEGVTTTVSEALNHFCRCVLHEGSMGTSVEGALSRLVGPPSTLGWWRCAVPDASVSRKSTSKRKTRREVRRSPTRWSQTDTHDSGGKQQEENINDTGEDRILCENAVRHVDDATFQFMATLSAPEKCRPYSAIRRESEDMSEIMLCPTLSKYQSRSTLSACRKASPCDLSCSS